MISAGIVLAFYLVAAFADFIAYSEPFDTEAARSYIPPQPIHWFDADGHFHPQVYALKGKRDPRTFKLSYAPDPSDPRDLVLFGHGYPYDLFGLIPDRSPSARPRQRQAAGCDLPARHRSAGARRVLPPRPCHPHIADHRAGRA